MYVLIIYHQERPHGTGSLLVNHFNGMYCYLCCSLSLQIV
uniref:Uncharacterized protein n=1 Tax=Arundo donax TaxID=35708 RepID=A0A0A9G7X9_ARUDO